MFSTITTAPSAIMPMPMASPPSDMRFALKPYQRIMMKAKSAASGRTSVTMIALRRSASKTMSMMKTKIAPSASALVTVLIAVLTRSVRS